MERTCKITGTKFELTDQDLGIYRKLNVPLSDICTEERQRQKMAFRNEKSLYKGKCHLCGKSVVTIFSEDSPYTIYCNECWWGDKWHALDYGADFNFDRTFFEQF